MGICGEIIMVSVTNPKPTSHPTADTDVFKTRLDGDTNNRFVINADGKIEWGNGTDLKINISLPTAGNHLRISAPNTNHFVDIVPHGSSVDFNNPIDGGRIRLYGRHDTESIILRRSTLVGNEQPSSSVPLIVKGAASQTADLQQWQDSAGGVRGRMRPVGQLTLDIANGPGVLFLTQEGGVNKTGLDTRGLRYLDAANEQTTIGAAGTAAALPAAPTKYLRVVDSAGNILAIPAYASA